MTFEPVKVLAVRYGGRTIGAVSAAEQRGLYAFEYESTWRRSGIEISPALMPLKDRRSTWIFPGLDADTFLGLPPMLADSLPDRFGNSIINAALAREGVRPEQIGPLDRLAYIGSRGMGALTFEPATGPSGPSPTSIELSQLVTAARDAVAGRLSDDTTSANVLNQILTVGSSAGGARAKAVVAWNRATNELRAGNLDTPPGYEQWLLKFDGVESTDKGTTFSASRPYNRREFAYSLMARAAGIDMPETHLLEENGRAHFMTRRFDRPTPERRLHVQTLCGMDAMDFNQTGAHDYASLMLRVAELDAASGAREEVLRRIAFNVLAANNDDHTKNHAFLMDADGSWSLSPAYDLTFADDPNNTWLRQHLMSVNGKFSGITLADLLEFADRHEVPNAKSVIGQVADAVAGWESFAATSGLQRSDTSTIKKRFDALRDGFGATLRPSRSPAT